MKIWLIILSVLVCGNFFPARGAETGDEVAVVYNTRVPESQDVAEHYAAMRQVPAKQVIGLDLPDQETISRSEFRDHLQKRLMRELESRGLLHFESISIPATATEQKHSEKRVTRATIRYLVLCYGVPLAIARDSFLHESGEDKLKPELQRNEAAVDSELACLPMPDHRLAGFLGNSCYGSTNAVLMNPTNGLLLVTRLDGPSAAVARGLVDKALMAERDGLWGRAYFDLRGITNGDYKIGDNWINQAAQICRNVGYETIIDTNAGTFPASFPLSQVAFYAGWYDENASGPFSLPLVEFMPGAFAYHLHSFSAATLHSTKQHWVGPLLARGATATMGCVAEPYLEGTPDIGTFFERFMRRDFTFGEAAYASQSVLSWQTTVVGDPLYRPFHKEPAVYAKDLENRHDPLAVWVELFVVNQNLSRGVTMTNVIKVLERMPDTPSSSVLEEKLADLYQLSGQPSSSVYSLQRALRLDTTPQQRKRLMLELAQRLIPLGRETEAYGVYQRFLTEFPEYSDKAAIYGALVTLAEKLDKKSDEEAYQRKLNEISPAHAPMQENKPPVRHGV